MAEKQLEKKQEGKEARAEERDLSSQEALDQAQQAVGQTLEDAQQSIDTNNPEEQAALSGFRARVGKLWEGFRQSFSRSDKELDDQPEDMSRRKFLELGGKAAAGAVIGGAVLEARASEFDPEDEERYLEIFRKLNDIREEIEGYQPLTILERGAKMNEKMRQAFLDRISNEEIADFIISGDKVHAIPATYMHLLPFSAHGLLLRYVAENRPPEEYDDFVQENFTEDMHYFIRASDFLPTADQIKDFEIDPRLSMEKKAKERGNAEHEELVQSTIEAYPGWASPSSQETFKILLSNEKIRQALQESDCTLAEAYSIIKNSADEMYGIIKVYGGEQILDTQVTEIENKVMEMLTEREKIKNKEILGPETDKLIHFNFYEEGKRQFEPELIENLALNCGVEEKNIQEIDTSHHLAKSHLLRAITESRGNTTVFLNTHGDIEGSLAIKEGSPNHVLPETIAAGLVDRLLATKDPDDLSRIKLVFTSCFGEDTVLQIVSSLRMMMERYGVEEELGVKIDDVPMPDILTTAPRGSLGYSTDTLKNCLPAIAREGRWTMGHFMQIMQPADYGVADYGIFIGQPGNVRKIGERLEKQKDQALA